MCTDFFPDGGSIQPGYSKLLKKPINITSALEAHGAYIYNRLKNPDDPSQTQDEILTDLEKESCPGSGACGGMFTANTMAMMIETLGLSLPGSSSTPATSPAKMRECHKAAEAIKICMEKNIRPRDECRAFAGTGGSLRSAECLSSPNGA